jgi:peptidyl-dipeptidase Dcp
MNRTPVVLAAGFALLAGTACTDADAPGPDDDIMTSADNPLLAPSTLDLGYPRFDRIEVEHYMPAFERAMEAQLDEVEAITGSEEAPTFDNTLVALERSGRLLDRVSSVFFAMTSAHTNDDLRAIESEMAPRLSAHGDQILLDPVLFDRVAALYETRAALDLDPEALRLVEETYKDFVRAGAQLGEAEKSRLREINAELARLSTAFSQNVLAEVNDMAIVVDEAAELAGLTPAEIQTAADAAAERELGGR